LVELERLTFDLKKHCACGGTLKERTIELQGDVAAAVLPFLQQRGYAPVRAGG
jgi:translation initiation factor 1